jgi:transketolase
MSKNFIKKLEEKSIWVRKETLKIHKILPETRLASSLSPVEIFVVLYYGKILKFNSHNLSWEGRDRFIISKPHGAISLYPILTDFDFFDKSELKKVGQEGSLLGGIPDSTIPGFETTNGALGHGLGVACGVALGLKNRNSKSKVFVLLGDGELNEGSVWEAIMFAGHHKLSNLILIIDNNKISMLDFCKNIIDLAPLQDKFQAFRWKVKIVDGHNIKKLYKLLKELKEDKSNYPKVLIANTIKGKGVPQLEKDALCHVKTLNKDEIINAIKKLDEQ